MIMPTMTITYCCQNAFNKAAANDSHFHDSDINNIFISSLMEACHGRKLCAKVTIENHKGNRLTISLDTSRPLSAAIREVEPILEQFKDGYSISIEPND